MRVLHQNCPPADGPASTPTLLDAARRLVAELHANFDEAEPFDCPGLADLEAAIVKAGGDAE